MDNNWDCVWIKRLVATICLLVVIAPAIVGCGGNPTAENKPQPADDEPKGSQTNDPDKMAGGVDSGDTQSGTVAQVPFVKPENNLPGTVDTHIDPVDHQVGIPTVIQTSQEELQFAKTVEELGVAAAEAEDKKDFAAAIAKRQELFDLISKKYGDDAWQTTNARLSLEQTRNFGQMDAEQQARAEAITQYQHQALELAGQNNFEEAVRALGMAVSQCEAFWGPKHHLTARAKYRQGELYRAIGYFPQAVALYKSALEIEDEAIGRNHPRTIEVLNALAATAFHRGQMDDAYSWQEQAVSAAENAFGKNSAEYAGVLRELAAVKLARGDLEGALSIYQQVLQIRQASLGDKDKLTSESAYELARTYYQAERFEEAIPKLETAIGRMNRTHGGANNLTLLARNNLAMAYVGNGDFEDAEKILLELLETRRTLVGDQHVDYATAQHHLAILYANQGDMPKAEPYVLSAMKIYQRKLGPTHPLMTDVTKTYAAMLRHSGQVVKAEQLEAALREIADSARGVQGPQR